VLPIKISIKGGTFSGRV